MNDRGDEPVLGAPPGVPAPGAQPPPARAVPPPLPVGPLPVAPLRRNFCRICGTAWEPAWEYCLACFARASSPLPSLGLIPKIEGPSVGAALALYFALLAASAVGLLASAADADSLGVDFAITAAHTAIVLGWCAYSWRDV